MHISVLLDEAINALSIKEDGIYVDATLGYAGHSSEILKRIKKGHLFAIDQDYEAIEKAEKKLKTIGDNYTIINSNFQNIKEELKNRDVFLVDGILFDLGVSSVQLDEEERGFSYHHDGPLDMRMNKNEKFSAYDVVNTYSEEALAKIIFKYGEDKHARSIAHNIVKKRLEKNIETTLELAEIVKSSYPEKERFGKHPARRTFQAIRIEVNHELDVLEKALTDSLSLLKVGGRIAVITFHSLEDRIVKNIFKEASEIDPKVKGLPLIPSSYLPDFTLVNKHAIIPTDEEILKNNRARSAKLRIIKRIK